ncbi:MAG: GcrA family cell cycle regulator [bacterium]
MAGQTSGKFIWTNEAVEFLKARWAKDDSASEIADGLGVRVSQNAVIGKLHRLGLLGDRVKRRPDDVLERKVRRKRVRKAAGLDTGLQNVIPPLDESAAIGPRVSMTQLSETTCRWPFGDSQSEGFAYCGALPKQHSPYCPHHSRVAFAGGNVSKPVPGAGARGGF